MPLEEDRLTYIHDYSNSGENRIVTDKFVLYSVIYLEKNGY